MDSKGLMFKLIGFAACGCEADREAVDPQLICKACQLASLHDLAHLVAHAASELGLPAEAVPEKHRQELSIAAFRYVQLNFEYQRICKIFAHHKIPYLPLKGTVLRNAYPEPWMRTSCDMDILVAPEHLDAAISALTRDAGYRQEGSTSVDVSLYTPNGVHLELHHDMGADYVSPKAETALQDVWQVAQAVEGMSYCYALPDAHFYYYHMAHTAKHVLIGGCGVRPVLDVWILNHRVDHDRQARLKLLQLGGLDAFAHAVESLAEVWFSGAQMSAMSGQLESYILTGGVYGSGENRVTVGQQRKGGKLGYALFRVFPPRSYLMSYYPVLEKHGYLLPLYWVLRWIRVVFQGRFGKSVKELRTNSSVSASQADSAHELMEYLKLI